MQKSDLDGVEKDGFIHISTIRAASGKPTHFLVRVWSVTDDSVYGAYVTRSIEKPDLFQTFQEERTGMLPGLFPLAKHELHAIYPKSGPVADGEGFITLNSDGK